jgi:hypothetical protein
VMWHTPAIPALGRLRQGELKFEVSLGSINPTVGVLRGCVADTV